MNKIPPPGPSAPMGVATNNPRELMNKTMNIQKDKMNFSLIEQR